MKYVYLFSEGNKEMKNLLGGKGANLAEMINIGLPVPMGFTVTTEACTEYYNDNKQLKQSTEIEILETIKRLEAVTKKEFGNPTNPLLLSIRSGSRASMPGMMDTVLNLGLNDEVAEGFSKVTNNPRFVYDSYRRFIQMYSDVVMDLPKSVFETIFDQMKLYRGVVNDSDLSADELKAIVRLYKGEYQKLTGTEFPQDPKEQLISSIVAVFKSWNNDRAKTYRRLNDIPSEWGTAVNVQEMVYGNKGNTCGTGVAFTRNPATGEKKLYGEYLINAQGEDVVAGTRTPEDIETLRGLMPEVYDEFVKINAILENHYKDMQDMEFTIEDGKLYMLQTRNGKRTAQAALRIAVEMVNEGMCTKEEAIMSVNPKQLDQLLHPKFDEESLEKAVSLAEGLAASPGAAMGRIYFTSDDIVKAHDAGIKDTLLVRVETSPEDIEGMNLTNGILTLRGGMTSHAAVVARGMGTCCVCGCNELRIDEHKKQLITKDGKVFNEGDYMSLNGTTGKVYGESIKTVEPEISGHFEQFMSWADDIRTMNVRANADLPKDAQQARKFGAEGIGLCRTEHMFFEGNRIFNFRKMIVAKSLEDRKKALELILPYQRSDFEGLFREMKGYGVTIRFLDPPLHEFLPHSGNDIRMLAESLNVPFEELRARVEALKEFNPMMGHRGLRLSITYPEIAQMQTRAVIEAAINVANEGINVEPEIMIPLASDKKEFEYVRNIVVETANKIIDEKRSLLKYSVGAMIEIPRAALLADEIAETAEFFSYGTNDLTQMAYGFSRDDAASFLGEYYKKGIFDQDPFESLDQKGVGQLITTSVTLGKKTRPDIKLGICGEHGGDPKSIEFCYNAGLDYVSCSPYRVPVARLALAQAKIKADMKN